ncbi:hypothetical protein R3P38DRAFT_2899177 [Favolaschia claudopus]|uniref:F-box domain-containing protein n=1 Tax=Favolaschia claudopus TaxID=2862362 RepID=A0AAW0CJG2_9AGAR
MFASPCLFVVRKWQSSISFRTPTMPHRTCLFGIDAAPILSICPEIILMILRQCSPMDLVYLSDIAVFRKVLEDHPSCWSNARSSVLSLPKPALLFSELQHAKMVFEGGICAVCSNDTDEVMLSFSLKIRCCAKCKKTAYRQLPGLRTVSLPELVASRGLTWAPFQIVGRGVVLRNVDVIAMAECYRVVQEKADDINEFIITHLVADQTDDCIALEDWKGDYLREKAAVSAQNTQFLRRIAGELQIKWIKLLKSPTFSRIVNAFNRDLALLGRMDWALVSRQVLAEIRLTRALSPPPRIIPVRTAAYGCQICTEGTVGRQISDMLTLYIHARIMHPSYFAAHGLSV